MKDKHNEISDNEIRIIVSDGDKSSTHTRTISWRVWMFVTAIVVAACAIAAAVVFSGNEDAAEPESIPEPTTRQYVQPVPPVRTQTAVDDSISAKAYTQVRDTIVDGLALRIFTPVNAKPSLEVGYKTLSDTTIVLAAQAADIRRDNGRIVCACVVKGELLSKGVAKAGFCSIIDGEITIGVADATPMFEQALVSDGDFFRQYPLVVSGQIVENKPKNKSIRKALAEIDGKACVVMSTERLSFHDFSQALVDAGVRNAIYIVGGDALYSYKDEDDNRELRGRGYRQFAKSVNFIVWR